MLCMGWKRIAMVQNQFFSKNSNRKRVQARINANSNIAPVINHKKKC